MPALHAGDRSSILRLSTRFKFYGQMAERLRSGLQTRVSGFDSRFDLQVMRVWYIGRTSAFQAVLRGFDSLLPLQVFTIRVGKGFPFTVL